jgi:flavin-dependent dehydrogenase
MESCDILIVGGGPAGSSCAWRLAQYGYDVLVIDKSVFPRDKICAGWITPQVIQSLNLDVADYSSGRVFQPMTAFRTSLLGHPSVEVPFDQPVSYGIRRCEFDDYLLRRSMARLRLGEAVQSFERAGDRWIVNGSISARMLVGAGGHFCPVARTLRSRDSYRPPLVTAVEAEFPWEDAGSSDTKGNTPRLFFCEDLAGYGWCVRKDGYLNIGLGRIDARDVTMQWPQFLEWLRRDGSFTGELPKAVHGHAYHVYDGCRTAILDEGVLLIGDAAGLADPKSGEGIRPAVESGLLAADVIHASQGRYERARLQRYRDEIVNRFGGSPAFSGFGKSFRVPRRWRTRLMSRLIANRWFSRSIILERWFLHRGQPALQPAPIPSSSATSVVTGVLS